MTAPQLLARARMNARQSTRAVKNLRKKPWSGRRNMYGDQNGSIETGGKLRGQLDEGANPTSGRSDHNDAHSASKRLSRGTSRQGGWFGIHRSECLFAGVPKSSRAVVAHDAVGRGAQSRGTRPCAADLWLKR